MDIHNVTVLHTIFDENSVILSWEMDSDGNHVIVFCDTHKRAQQYFVTSSQLDSYREGLAVVVSALGRLGHASYSTRTVQASNVRMTAMSHWMRKNHCVDILSFGLDDCFYDWKLHRITHIKRHDAESMFIRARVEIYRVAETVCGREYAATSKTINLKRPIEWLNHHFRGGRALFEHAEALSLDNEQMAAALQDRYFAYQQSASASVIVPTTF